MEKFRLILIWVFAGILISAGINHFVHPQFYAPLIPAWMPLIATNYFTGVIEAGLGIALLIPVCRRLAAVGTMFLMLFFLPFHLVDALRQSPAIGSHLVAWLRFAFQFVFIYWAWFLVPKAR